MKKDKSLRKPKLGLESKRNLIHNVVKEEENSFLKTLNQGLLLLDSMISKNVDGKIEGSKVFQLYDTYGFPKDLTALILSEKGFSFDEEEFEKSMKKQKETSKKAAFSSKGDWVIIHEDDLEEFALVEQMPKLEGKQMVMVLAPKKKK